MGFRINTNTAALSAHASATMNNRALDSSLSKLNSGFRITSAADDASGMAIADSLRSQANALGQAIMNANDAIGVIQTADKAMDEQIKILDTIKTKAIQAAQDTQTTETRRALQADINRLMEQLDNIGNTTSFNGQKLLSGNFSNKEFQIGAYSNETIKASIGATTSDKIGLTRFETGHNVRLSDVVGPDGQASDGKFTLTFKNVDGINDITLEPVRLASITKGEDGEAHVQIKAGQGLGGLVEAINKASDATGIRASANVKSVFKKVISAGSTTEGFKINGVTIGKIAVQDKDANGALRAAINRVTDQTGVEASVDSRGRLVLANRDGRGIMVEDGKLPEKAAVSAGIQAPTQTPEEIRTQELVDQANSLKATPTKLKENAPLTTGKNGAESAVSITGNTINVNGMLSVSRDTDNEYTLSDLKSDLNTNSNFHDATASAAKNTMIDYITSSLNVAKNGDVETIQLGNGEAGEFAFSNNTDLDVHALFAPGTAGAPVEGDYRLGNTDGIAAATDLQGIYDAIIAGQKGLDKTISAFDNEHIQDIKIGQDVDIKDPDNADKNNPDARAASTDMKRLAVAIDRRAQLDGFKEAVEQLANTWGVELDTTTDHIDSIAPNTSGTLSAKDKTSGELAKLAQTQGAKVKDAIKEATALPTDMVDDTAAVDSKKLIGPGSDNASIAFKIKATKTKLDETDQTKIEKQAQVGMTALAAEGTSHAGENTLTYKDIKTALDNRKVFDNIHDRAKQAMLEKLAGSIDHSQIGGTFKAGEGVSTMDFDAGGKLENFTDKVFVKLDGGGALTSNSWLTTANIAGVFDQKDVNGQALNDELKAQINTASNLQELRDALSQIQFAGDTIKADGAVNEDSKLASAEQITAAEKQIAQESIKAQVQGWIDAIDELLPATEVAMSDVIGWDGFAVDGASNDVDDVKFQVPSIHSSEYADELADAKEKGKTLAGLEELKNSFLEKRDQYQQKLSADAEFDKTPAGRAAKTELAIATQKYQAALEAGMDEIIKPLDAKIEANRSNIETIKNSVDTAYTQAQENINKLLTETKFGGNNATVHKLTANEIATALKAIADTISTSGSNGGDVQAGKWGAAAASKPLKKIADTVKTFSTALEAVTDAEGKLIGFGNGLGDVAGTPDADAKIKNPNGVKWADALKAVTNGSLTHANSFTAEGTDIKALHDFYDDPKEATAQALTNTTDGGDGHDYQTLNITAGEKALTLQIQKALGVVDAAATLDDISANGPRLADLLTAAADFHASITGTAATTSNSFGKGEATVDYSDPHGTPTIATAIGDLKAISDAKAALDKVYLDNGVGANVGKATTEDGKPLSNNSGAIEDGVGEIAAATVFTNLDADVKGRLGITDIIPTLTSEAAVGAAAAGNIGGQIGELNANVTTKNSLTDLKGKSTSGVEITASQSDFDNLGTEADKIKDLKARSEAIKAELEKVNLNEKALGAEFMKLGQVAGLADIEQPSEAENAANDAGAAEVVAESEPVYEAGYVSSEKITPAAVDTTNMNEVQKAVAALQDDESITVPSFNADAIAGKFGAGSIKEGSNGAEVIDLRSVLGADGAAINSFNIKNVLAESENGTGALNIITNQTAQEALGKLANAIGDNIDGTLVNTDDLVDIKKMIGGSFTPGAELPESVSGAKTLDDLKNALLNMKNDLLVANPMPNSRVNLGSGASEEHLDAARNALGAIDAAAQIDGWVKAIDMTSAKLGEIRGDREVHGQSMADIIGLDKENSVNFGRLSLVGNSAKDIQIEIKDAAGNDMTSAAGFDKDVNEKTVSLRETNAKTERDVAIAQGFNSEDWMDDDASEGANGYPAGVMTFKGAQAMIDIAETAQKALEAIRSDLGSVQNQLVVTVNNISVTQVNVKAAESNIRDVDFAQESATFSKHQILAQSGVYAMSQANAVQQNVMRLLQ